MRIFRLTRALLRDLLVPALCALIALSGIVQARAHGGKAYAAETTGYLTLCTQTNTAGGHEPAPDHDCSDCCLPRLTTIPGTGPALLFHIAASTAVMPDLASRLSGGSATGLPWSRGPPAAA